MTTTQRALIAKAVLPHYKEAAKARQQEGQERGRAVQHGKVDAGSSAHNHSGATGHRARDEAAGEIGVSGRTLERLTRVEPCIPHSGLVA